MADRKKGRPVIEKQIVVALVERNGAARYMQIPNARAETLSRVLSTVKAGTKLMIDDSVGYRWTFKNCASHEKIDHNQGEYVRGKVHTNSVEDFFSILRRGLYGTYQHISEAYLRRLPERI